MIFLDTSILIAAAQSSHIHYEHSAELLRSATRSTTACGAHSLAETYATLSGMPKPARLPLPAVMRIVEQIRERVKIVTLTDKEYLATLERLSAAGLIGGIAYDALLIECARKVDSKRIYSWNARHFRLLAPDLADRIFTP